MAHQLQLEADSTVEYSHRESVPCSSLNACRAGDQSRLVIAETRVVAHRPTGVLLYKEYSIDGEWKRRFEVVDMETGR